MLEMNVVGRIQNLDTLIRHNQTLNSYLDIYFSKFEAMVINIGLTLL